MQINYIYYIWKCFKITIFNLKVATIQSELYYNICLQLMQPVYVICLLINLHLPVHNVFVILINDAIKLAHSTRLHMRFKSGKYCT